MLLSWGFLLIAQRLFAHAQELKIPDDPSCADLPTQSERIMCNQRAMMEKRTKAALAELNGRPAPQPFGSAAAPDLQDCMDITCVCSFLTGAETKTCTYKGQKVGKAVRKEIRMLSTDERQRFLNAIVQLKRDGTLDRISSLHTRTSQAALSNAHDGPAFLPWHREYVKRLELELRRVDPTVAVPYWDSRLDSRLGPRGSDIVRSILFTDIFLGNGNGAVTSGPFKNFRNLATGRTLTRNYAGIPDLTTDDDFNSMMRLNSINDFLGYRGFRIASSRCRPGNNQRWWPENVHGRGHTFIGGDMTYLAYAAYDPAFFLHHSFVDYWLEKFRQEKQTYNERELRYADNWDCMIALHFPNQTMSEMNIRIIDGLSNKYTDNLYTYQEPPTCSRTKQDCGSEFLFCNVDSRGGYKCVSKIAIGKSCSGFNGLPVCHNGYCSGGICVRNGPQPSSSTAAPVTTSAPDGSFKGETCFDEGWCCPDFVRQGRCRYSDVASWCRASCSRCSPTVFSPPFTCFDRDQHCSFWARSGECQKNPTFMHDKCRFSCGTCKYSQCWAG